MFGINRLKNDVESLSAKVERLEQLISDSKRTEQELKSHNHRLSMTLKTIVKKLIMRLPISVESLEKGLAYDLIFVAEFDSWRKMSRDGMIIDVRPTVDFQRQSLPGAVNIPYEMLPVKAENLPKDKPLLLVCENGIRSVSASELLSSKGFSFLYVLQGGMGLVREHTDPRPEELAANA